MASGVAAGSAAAIQAQQNADDISFDEWWGTTFLRLSLRVWFWIGISLFVTFVLTVVTLEVMKAYEVGPYKTQGNAGPSENTKALPSATTKPSEKAKQKPSKNSKQKNSG